MHAIVSKDAMNAKQLSQRERSVAAAVMC